MKKIVLNVAFAAAVLTFLTSNAWCTVTGPSAPDAASTSALLGVASLGLVAARKFLR
jgi:hypothetical protein